MHRIVEQFLSIGNLDNFSQVHIGGSDQAITALQTGSVNVLDSQFHLETQPSFLTDWGTNGLAIYDAFGVQEMGINMKHRILGTGVDTPLGKSDPSKAALAAKYVRQAISYAVPRELLIQQLLNGYGNPAITTPVVGNAATGFAVTEGFNANLHPYGFNLTKSRELLIAAGYFPPPPAAAPSFWEAYGLYIVGALIAVIVVLSAVYVMRVRRSPLSPTTMPAQPATPSTTSPQ